MKRLLIVFMILLIISGCSNQDSSDNGNSAKEDNISDNISNGQETNENKELIVWDIRPVLEYDNIENWLTTRWGFYSDYNAEGATSDYTKPSDFYSVSYNRNDFYNSDGCDKFIIGSFEKGGLMVKKDGYWGLINSKGEIKAECRYTYKTHLFHGVIFSGGWINHDYTLDGKEFGGGGGTGTSLLFIDLNGNVYSAEEENKYGNSYYYQWKPNRFTKIDLFEDAMKSGYVEDDSFLVLNSYAGMIDHENYFSDVKLPSNCIEAYTIIDKDGYKFLDVPSNYVINDISEGIISFAECTTDPRNIPTYDDEYGGKLAMFYYAYELYCDRYNYRNYTFFDRDGNLIARGFDDAYGFYDGYAAVKKNGKWGFIDKHGDLVVDYIFDKATALSEGKSWVIYNGKTGRLNLVELLENNIEINSDILEYETIMVE